MFKEAREGTTPAMQYWYFPSERIGKEFIYPKQQAQIIANRTGASVLSEEGAGELSIRCALDGNDGAVTRPHEGAAKAPAESQAQVQGVESPQGSG